MNRRNFVIGSAAISLASCTHPFWDKDIVVPTPTRYRNDLMYGYFGCLDNQVFETKDQINLLMECNWNGLSGCIANIKSAQKPTMLDVSWYVFTTTAKGDGRIVRQDAESMLTNYFNSLQASGVLEYVKILYPMDEPNNVVTTEAEFIKGINLIRKVASSYRELSGAKYAVIYATDKPYMAIGEFDYAGFDDYDNRSSVLKTWYPMLLNQLKPWQKTILVPGGQSPWKQDPTPFVNFAEENLEVGMVLPFIWADVPDSGKGIRSNGMAAQYTAAGKTICNGGPTK